MEDCTTDKTGLYDLCVTNRELADLVVSDSGCKKLRVSKQFTNVVASAFTIGQTCGTFVYCNRQTTRNRPVIKGHRRFLTTGLRELLALEPVSLVINMVLRWFGRVEHNMTVTGLSYVCQ